MTRKAEIRLMICFVIFTGDLLYYRFMSCNIIDLPTNESEMGTCLFIRHSDGRDSGEKLAELSEFLSLDFECVYGEKYGDFERMFRPSNIEEAKKLVRDAGIQDAYLDILDELERDKGAWLWLCY